MIFHIQSWRLGSNCRFASKKITVFKNYTEFLSIAIKYNNFDDKTLKIIFIQGLFNEIQLLMTLKFIKLMTEAYFINKFYIWIQNWTINVKHASSFSSTSDYQQLWSNNNICFFISCYPLIASAVTSEIKSITSSVLYTAVVSTIIHNYIPTTPNSYFQPSLNEAKKKHCCNNNLYFYYKKLDY